MKKKFFVRGLGVGMIITSLILCVYYRKQTSDMATISRAKQLGMVFEEKKTEAEVSPSPSVSPSVSPQQTTNVTPGATTTTKSTPEPEQTAQNKKTTNPSTTMTKKPERSLKENNMIKRVYTFTVQKGQGSSTIASQLQKQGIIDDASKFDQFLIDNKYAERISVGTFKIDSTSDYKQIATILTK